MVEKFSSDARPVYLRVNIAFLKTNNKWILGVGDEAISQIAPAMAQTIFKITGKRIRSLPFGKQDLSWAYIRVFPPGAIAG